MHGIAAGAIRPEVFEPRKPLLEVAVEDRRGLAVRLIARYCQALDLDEHRGGDDGESGEGEPDAPVGREGDDEDAEEHDGVSKHMKDDVLEEPGDCVHVSVDSFDEDAGGVVAVPGEVEAEHPLGEIAAKGVPGLPGDADRTGDHDIRQRLAREADAEVREREAEEIAARLPSQRSIDDPAEQNGTDERQRR